MCDNDDCYEEENGWVHVGDCVANSAPLLTRKEAWEKILNAPEKSFLAAYGGSLTYGLR
jgi:hypothetical protein